MKIILKGFTLIELLVVIAIMAVVGTFTLANFSDFGKDKELQNAALDIQSLLRTAQTNALASVKCNGNSAENWFVEFAPPATINLKCNNVATPVKSLVLGNNIQLGTIENTSPTVSPPACPNFKNGTTTSQTCTTYYGGPQNNQFNLTGTKYIKCTEIPSNINCGGGSCGSGVVTAPNIYNDSAATSVAANNVQVAESACSPPTPTVTLTLTGGSSGGSCTSPVKFNFTPLSGAFWSNCNNSSIMQVGVQNAKGSVKLVKVTAGGSMSIAEGVAVSPLPAASNTPTPTPATTSTPAPTPSQSPPPSSCPSSGLVAYWKMDGSWSDFSGNGHNGTGINGVSFTAGKLGNGGSFDGVDDYITADSVNAGLTGSGFSFGGWVKPRIVKRASPLSFHSIAGENRNVIFLSLDGAQKFHYWDDTPPWGSNQINSVSTYATGTYYHVFVTIDGSNNGKLYINGITEATFTTTFRPASNGKFSIGQEWDGASASDFFDGMIDEVGVWSRALSSAEIATLYNSGIGLTCP